MKNQQITESPALLLFSSKNKKKNYFNQLNNAIIQYPIKLLLQILVILSVFKNSLTFKVLILTDIHLNIFENKPIEYLHGKNTSIEMLKTTIKSLTTKPDLVIINGDSLDHKINHDPTIDNHKKIKIINETFRVLVHILTKKLGKYGIPILPVIGNNDSSSTYHTDRKAEDMEYFKYYTKLLNLNIKKAMKKETGKGRKKVEFESNYTEFNILNEVGEDENENQYSSSDCSDSDDSDIDIDQENKDEVKIISEEIENQVDKQQIITENKRKAYNKNNYSYQNPNNSNSDSNIDKESSDIEESYNNYIKRNKLFTNTHISSNILNKANITNTTISEKDSELKNENNIDYSKLPSIKKGFYYSYIHQNIRFIMLNSLYLSSKNKYLFTKEVRKTSIDMLNFLKQNLDLTLQTKDQRAIVFMHIPPVGTCSWNEELQKYENIGGYYSEYMKIFENIVLDEKYQDVIFPLVTSHFHYAKVYSISRDNNDFYFMDTNLEYNNKIKSKKSLSNEELNKQLTAMRKGNDADGFSNYEFKYSFNNKIDYESEMSKLNDDNNKDIIDSDLSIRNIEQKSSSYKDYETEERKKYYHIDELNYDVEADSSDDNSNNIKQCINCNNYSYHYQTSIHTLQYLDESSNPYINNYSAKTETRKKRRRTKTQDLSYIDYSEKLRMKELENYYNKENKENSGIQEIKNIKRIESKIISYLPARRISFISGISLGSVSNIYKNKSNSHIMEINDSINGFLSLTTNILHNPSEIEWVENNVSKTFFNNKPITNKNINKFIKSVLSSDNELSRKWLRYIAGYSVNDEEFDAEVVLKTNVDVNKLNDGNSVWQKSMIEFLKIEDDNSNSIDIDKNIGDIKDSKEANTIINKVNFENSKETKVSKDDYDDTIKTQLSILNKNTDIINKEILESTYIISKENLRISVNRNKLKNEQYDINYKDESKCKETECNLEENLANEVNDDNNKNELITLSDDSN